MDFFGSVGLLEEVVEPSLVEDLLLIDLGLLIFGN